MGGGGYFLGKLVHVVGEGGGGGRNANNTQISLSRLNEICNRKYT